MNTVLLLVSYISLIMLFLHDRLKLHGGKGNEKTRSWMTDTWIANANAMVSANPAKFPRLVF